MRIGWAVGILLALGQLQSAAQTVDADAPVVRLQLYKNGLAVVHRRIDIPADGLYRLRDVPAARHGTFWIESDARVVTRSTVEAVEEPAGPPRAWADFAGREVAVTLRGGQILRGNVPSTQAGDGALFVLETADGGHTALASSEIVTVAAEPGAEPMARKTDRPVLEFDAKGVPEGGGAIVFSYLTEGLSWAPSYRLERRDTDRLVITQSAVVRNDWADFETAPVEAISGFPNLEFANVLSPMAGGATIANFLNQVNQSGRNVPFFLDNGVVTQQAVTSNRFEPAFAPPVAPVDGDAGAADLHLQELGAFAMKRGDALSLDTLHGETACAKKVRWIVRSQGDRAVRAVPSAWRSRVGDPWDMLVFTNPFAQPLTTAPALVVQGGQLRGQTTLYWTNPKGETELPFTKALSIETRHEEYEDPAARTETTVLNQRHVKLVFKGQAIVTNRRADPVDVEVVHFVEGTMTHTDGGAEVRALPEHATRLNPFHELRWTLTLAPNETAVLPYGYTRIE